MIKENQEQSLKTSQGNATKKSKETQTGASLGDIASLISSLGSITSGTGALFDGISKNKSSNLEVAKFDYQKEKEKINNK